MDEQLTKDYVVTQNNKSGEIEIWLDWTPAIDSNPHSSVMATLEGDDLLIIPSDNSDVDKKTRRITGLNKNIIEMMDNGFVLRLCGPSGVLAEHKLPLDKHHHRKE